MKLKTFIEENFMVDDMDTGALVPFKFRKVQSDYYDLLCKDYREEADFTGLRELILKARKEGFTSMVLAIFAAIMILSDNPVRFLEISYKDDATSQHYRRIKTYVMSYYRKKYKDTGVEVSDKAIESAHFESINEGHEFVLAHNKASFYVGTASTKTGQRGSNVQGVLFTEGAFYPNTNILRASEIIEGTRNMVPVGKGLVFMESTANGYNYFFNIWQKATNGEVDYKPRFFGWRQFYTPEQFELIKAGFADKSKIPQEYPDNANEAFLTTGTPVFDVIKLSKFREMKDMIMEAPNIGELLGVKQPYFNPKTNGWLKIWRMPERNKEYVIGADPCEGKASGDFASAQVLDKSTWEQVAVVHGKFEADIFAKELYKLGIFYNEALLIPERNSMGVAVIITLRDLFYPNIYIKPKLKGEISDNATPELGWQTNVKTKAQLISDSQEAIRNMLCAIHDEDTLDELFSFNYNENGQAQAAGNGHDDRVMAFMIAVKGCKDAPSLHRDSNYIMGNRPFKDSSSDLITGDTTIESEYF